MRVLLYGKLEAPGADTVARIVEAGGGVVTRRFAPHQLNSLARFRVCGPPSPRLLPPTSPVYPVPPRHPFAMPFCSHTFGFLPMSPDPPFAFPFATSAVPLPLRKLRGCRQIVVGSLCPTAR